MKCSNGSHWNLFSVNKVFIEQNTIEPKVKVFNSMYEPLEVSKCKKYDRIIVELKGIAPASIMNSSSVNS